MSNSIPFTALPALKRKSDAIDHFRLQPPPWGNLTASFTALMRTLESPAKVRRDRR
jgi:hypothetical protein